MRMALEAAVSALSTEQHWYPERSIHDVYRTVLSGCEGAGSLGYW